MNFLLFLFFYLICTAFLILSIYVVYKIILRRKAKALSKLNEAMLDEFFDKY